MNRALEIALACAMIAGCTWVIAEAVSVTPDARGYGTHESLGMEPCGFYRATGRPCPSCGMTTSFANMVRLRPLAAFRASPAGALLCLLTMAAPGWFLHALLTGRPPFRFLLHRRARWILPVTLTIVLLSWTYKIAAP